MLPQIAFPGGLICGLDCDSADTSTPGTRACAEGIIREFHAVSSPGRMAANVLTDVRHQVAVVLQRRERGGRVGRAATRGRRDSLDESLGSSVDHSRNDWSYVEVVEVVEARPDRQWCPRDRLYSSKSGWSANPLSRRFCMSERRRAWRRP